MAEIAILLILVCIQLSVGQEDITSICGVVQAGTRVRDPLSCDKWYVCGGSESVQPNECESGNFFDKNSGECLPSSEVACVLEGGNQCEGQTKSTVPDPATCDGYINCESGEETPFNCNAGFNFDPRSGVCVEASSYPCTTRTLELNLLCRVIPNNKHFGDVGNCTAWNICKDEVAYSGFCPKGYYYKSETGVCAYATKELCPDIPDDVPIISGSCTTPGSYQSDLTTCAGYNYCYDNGAGGVFSLWGSCQNGTYFNPAKNTCADRSKVNCAYDRCEGWTKSWANIGGSACRGYYVCRDGKAISQKDCPESTPYFDEMKQVCTPRPISYDFCA